MTHAQLCQETYQVVDLVVLCEERQLVPLLVLDECLDVHVEGVAGGTVRGLGSQLTLSRYCQRESHCPGITRGSHTVPV